MTVRKVRPAQLPMTEKDLLTAVRAMAQLLGWLCYHTHNSQRSEPGFPDLVLVHVGSGRILFRELKAERGRVTRDQQVWLTALQTVGQDAAIWRPDDLRAGRIQQQLATNIRTPKSATGTM